MKQQKLFAIVLTVCALLLVLAGCASNSAFDGSSAKNADSYHLDVKTMNGTDTHTLELKQGDTLKIQFETEKGSLEMKITAPDDAALYQGDGTVTEFTVEAPMDGAYEIVVVGQKAKGSIHVDVERASEAAEPETAAITVEELVGPWHLAVGENDEVTINETFPGAMEFGNTYGVMCAGAGNKPAAVALTAENFYDEIIKASSVLDDAEVPETGRVLVVTPAGYQIMKKCKDIVMETNIGNDLRLKGVIANLDGMSVQKIPANRLPADFGFMIAHPCATVAPTKLEEYKIHQDPPGISGNLVEGRICYDAFVLENKAKAIYYQAVPAEG